LSGDINGSIVSEVNFARPAARQGDVRDDVAADELAGYCLHALTAAGTVPSQGAGVGYREPRRFEQSRLDAHQVAGHEQGWPSYGGGHE
jgi:hypothetical protein